MRFVLKCWVFISICTLFLSSCDWYRTKDIASLHELSTSWREIEIDLPQRKSAWNITTYYEGPLNDTGSVGIENRSDYVMHFVRQNEHENTFVNPKQRVPLWRGTLSNIHDKRISFTPAFLLPDKLRLILRVKASKDIKFGDDGALIIKAFAPDGM